MHISSMLKPVLTASPAFGRSVLWALTRQNVRDGNDAHWFLMDLAVTLGYRFPALVKLGNGMKIKVPALDEAGKEITKTGWYEPGTVHLISSLLRPGMVFVDVGAAFGQYTVLAAAIVGSQGKVFAIEPEPESYAWLQSNIRRNRLQNCHTFRLALASKSGNKCLHVGTAENLGTTSFAKPYNFSGMTVDVPVEPFDDFAKSEGIDRVDLIKIDVEGAELDVLQRAESIFRWKASVIIEFEESNQKRFGRNCKQLAQLFLDRGYQLNSVIGDKVLPFEPAHIDEQFSFNVLATPANGRPKSELSSAIPLLPDRD